MSKVIFKQVTSGKNGKNYYYQLVRKNLKCGASIDGWSRMCKDVAVTHLNGWSSGKIKETDRFFTGDNSTIVFMVEFDD